MDSKALKSKIISTYELPYVDRTREGEEIRGVIHRHLAEGDAQKVVEMFGDRLSVVPDVALNGLTAAHFQLGNYVGADAVCTEAIRRSRETGDKQQESDALAYRGKVRWMQTKDVEQSIHFFRESLKLWPENDLPLLNWLCYSSRARRADLLEEGVRLILSGFPEWDSNSAIVHILTNDADMSWARRESVAVRELLEHLRRR